MSRVAELAVLCCLVAGMGFVTIQAAGTLLVVFVAMAAEKLCMFTRLRLHEFTDLGMTGQAFFAGRF